MLVFVDDAEEALRLTPVLRRAGYQVIQVENSSEVARWAGDAGGVRRAVIALRQAWRIESPAPDAPIVASPLRRIAVNVQFDPAHQTLIVDGEDRVLTVTESRLLEALLDHANRPLTRAQLIDLVWGYDYVGHEREVDVYVRYLRLKLEPEPTQPRFLITLHGLGYMLDVHRR